ncbi:hypothetical protein [Phormidium tenue]|jgi:hypothetical protein|uniref:hypothetical protein n=1 Tax=Phormidium tenue TaxID=126344 RepID=UPI0030D9A4CE
MLDLRNRTKSDQKAVSVGKKPVNPLEDNFHFYWILSDALPKALAIALVRCQSLHQMFTLFRLTFLFLAFSVICIVKSTHPPRTLKTA